VWMLKGIFFGVLAFVIFSIAFFLAKFSFSTHKAVSLSTLRYLTIQNPWFWAVFVLMVCTACACARLFAEIRN
jgi:hypothetical protein